MLLAALALAQAEPAAPQPLLPAAPATATCRLCDAERLRPWFRKLATARTAPRPLRILQLGDSHTAGDQITGAWRTILQTRYGSGGRGVLPPGRPYDGYLTRGITAAQSPGWTVSGIFGPTWRGGEGPPRGLANYSLSTAQDGAFLSLVADPTEYFDRFTACALAAPGAGTLTLAAGTSSVAVPLGSLPPGPVCTAVDSDMTTSVASATAVNGLVTVTSLATEERAGGGVILSNLGTVGAQFTHLFRADDRVVAAELRAYRPDLLVVAFGTNEAFKPGFSTAEYESELRAGLGRLKRLLPGVPMLVIGASDSGSKTPSIEGAACPDGSIWAPTAALPAVQATERRVAHEEGAAFWDWAQAMGGRCTANAWSGASPPLMRPDHVHFTTAGGAEIARLLQSDLDAAAGRVG